MHDQVQDRLQAKTPECQFVRMLQQEFHFAPKIAEAILAEAQSCLLGSPGSLRPGQVRVILTRNDVGHGRPLRACPTTAVVWTVDAGLEDRQVLQQHGRLALREVRLQRLLGEAVEQGALASQEDVAQSLHVSVRTIKRDCARLQQQGVELPTRGNLRGIGRGQTHKARIVGQWLEGHTYDQIARRTRHSLTAIQRYIQSFVRVISLQRQGFLEPQIALLAGLGLPLVREYLAVHEAHDGPAVQERLAAQLDRLGHAGSAQKGGQ
jgi:DNA-binding CsgD family transcriptional regulator